MSRKAASATKKPATPRKPRAKKTTSKAAPVKAEAPRYPNLQPAMGLLAVRLMEPNMTEDQRKVLEKWQKQLGDINTEILRLTKLEKFQKNLRTKDTTK